MNPAAKSLAISSLMALCFYLSKQRRRCLTGLEPDLIFKACSATSLGMPGISEAIHAKISLLVWRKSMSALSYLEESAVPTRAFLSVEFSGSMRTFFTPSVGSKDLEA
jgi:sensor histidine kinase regulating citrate/malate metabolism